MPRRGLRLRQHAVGLLCLDRRMRAGLAPVALAQKQRSSGGCCAHRVAAIYDIHPGCHCIQRILWSPCIANKGPQP